MMWRSLKLRRRWKKVKERWRRKDVGENLTTYEGRVITDRK